MFDQRGYPALWVRLQHRFGPRQMEWFMAAIMAAWGAVLLLPAETFAGEAWTIFRSIWSEFAWGGFMLVLGLIRLVGLFINGSRKDVTPWIRVVSAGIGFVIWIGICTGFALTGFISTWLAIYPIFAVAEIINVVRAGGDVEGKNGTAT